MFVPVLKRSDRLQTGSRLAVPAAEPKIPTASHLKDLRLALILRPTKPTSIAGAIRTDSAAGAVMDDVGSWRWGHWRLAGTVVPASVVEPGAAGHGVAGLVAG